MRATRVAVDLCALFLVFVAACSKSTTVEPEGAPCAMDANCSAGQVCLRPHPSALGPATCRPICASMPGLCESGSVCEGLWGEDPRTEWSCYAGGESAHGQPCTSDFACGRGMYCSDDGSPTPGLVCVEGCSETTDCPVGTYCRAGELQSVCVRRCVAGDPCATGAACINGVCTRLATWAAQCPTDRCADGEACDDRLPIGTMRCRPYAEIGCLRTGCPAGQVCFETCVARHE